MLIETTYGFWKTGSPTAEAEEAAKLLVRLPSWDLERLDLAIRPKALSKGYKVLDSGKTFFLPLEQDDSILRDSCISGGGDGNGEGGRGSHEDFCLCCSERKGHLFLVVCGRSA